FVGVPSVLSIVAASRRCQHGLRSRGEDCNSAMEGLRRWTTSPYPFEGEGMGCRGEHELPGIRQPILSPWSHDSWVPGCPAAPPSYAVGFLHHWAPWRSPGSSREYHCS